MGDTAAAPGARLLSLWQRLRPFPRRQGAVLDRSGSTDPLYPGTMGARVEDRAWKIWMPATPVSASATGGE